MAVALKLGDYKYVYLFPVAKSNKKRCTTDDPIHLPHGSGYISNLMDHGSEPGLHTCSWTLEAMTGQQIQASLIIINQHLTAALKEPLGYV